LYFKRQITLEMAMARSSNADELNDLITRGAAALTTPPPRPGSQTQPGQRPQMPLGRVGRQ